MDKPGTVEEAKARVEAGLAMIAIFSTTQHLFQMANYTHIREPKFIPKEKAWYYFALQAYISEIENLVLDSHMRNRFYLAQLEGSIPNEKTYEDILKENQAWQRAPYSPCIHDPVGKFEHCPGNPPCGTRLPKELHPISRGN